MEAVTDRKFDAIVIGSGPGGATVSRELSKQGAKVLILERGSNADIKGTMSQTLAIGLVPNRNLYVTPDWLMLIRATIVGGSSILAYATAFEPPYAMFDRYGIDLRREVEESKRELPLAPLSEALTGPAARRILQAARAMGLNWERLPKMVYQDKCRPDCDKCTMGCPYGAKWNARAYVSEACARGATLLTNARVTRLSSSDGRIDAVEFTRRGSKSVISAPLIVLAAGGIGTPLILRASGVMNAGRDFFFDPIVVVHGTVEDLRGGREFPMAAGFHDPEEGYVLADLAWPRWLYALFTAEVLRFDRLAAHASTLPIMVKIRDDLGGHLAPGGGVRKALGDADRTRLIRGAALARRILEQAGARHIFQTWYSAAHPGGTAKIGEVVDANLKTRYENLYICDCSVVPESWGLPPTLTLIALGRRLARHLASQLPPGRRV